jgi:hypothetical protein
MRCLLSQAIGCNVEMRPEKQHWLMFAEGLFPGFLSQQGSLESKRVAGRVRFRDADITSKDFLIGRVRLVKVVGSFLNKSVVFCWRFTGLQQNSGLSEW